MRHNVREVSKVSTSSLLQAKGVDWSYWQLIPRCRLYEAIYLALGLDPRKIDFDSSESVKPVELAPTDELQALLDTINRWFDIAESNLSQNGGELEPIRFLSHNPLKSEISISTFGRWANSLKLDLPSEFPKQQKHQAAPAAKSDQGTEHPAYFGNGKEYSPDWSYWKQLPVIKLGEAVCLSVEINPRLFKFNAHHKTTGIPGIESKGTLPETVENRRVVRLLIGRIEIAERNISTGQMVENEGDFYDGGSDIGTDIKLAVFVKWAKKVGWVLPDDFPLQQDYLPEQTTKPTQDTEHVSKLNIHDIFDEDDEAHPEELDIALQAWAAVAKKGLGSGGTVRQKLENWLEESVYDLKPEQVKRIATICNWDKSRGRK